MSKVGEPFVTIGQDEYAIVKEVFQKENNVGWHYVTLNSGFETEAEAEEALKEYVK